MTPTWDLFIILSFVIMAVYGFLLGRGRVLAILMNSYAALTVSTAIGSYAYDYLTKITDISHSFTLSMFGAKVFVFVTILFLLILNRELSGSYDNSSSSMTTAIYGILAAGIILSSVISFMGNVERTAIFSSSQLAIQVYDYQLFWLVAPILLMTGLTVHSKFKR